MQKSEHSDAASSDEAVDRIVRHKGIWCVLAAIGVWGLVLLISVALDSGGDVRKPWILAGVFGVFLTVWGLILSPFRRRGR